MLLAGLSLPQLSSPATALLGERAFTMLSPLACALLVLVAVATAPSVPVEHTHQQPHNADDVVVVFNKVRVKQHQQGTELVPGEEHHLKVIVKWEAVAAATGYEVCHQCDIDENGVRTSDAGTLSPVPVDHTCMAEMCFIKPACPPGVNTFSVRAARAKGDDDRWTAWSAVMKFKVDEEAKEAGKADHADHHEL